MLNIIVTGVTLAVLAILGALNPGLVLQTLPAGVVNTFAANIAWQNPFTKTSWIDLADASVALLADRVWPALIPGSTGTGRPYVVDFVDLPASNDTADALFYRELLWQSMTCQRLIDAQVTRIRLLQFVGLVVVGMIFLSFSRAIWLSVSKNTPALGFLERLCSMTNSYQVKKMREPLGQLLTEMRTAGQTPYLPSLTAHTDFVLEIIDSADDRYNASVRAQQLLEANEEELKQSTAKYDALLVQSEELRAQLAAKIQELEKNGRETKAIDNTRQQIQTALQKKTKGYDAVVQQLQNANTKCSGLEATLTTVQGSLQGATDRCGRLERELKAANDHWDAFSQGPSGIDDAINTPLPTPIDGELHGQPAVAPSSAVAPATAALNPAASTFTPVGQPPSTPSRNPAPWCSAEQAKEVHDQLIALQRAQLSGQLPSHGSRSLPAMTRRNSMGSLSSAGGFAAPSSGTVATGSSSATNGLANNTMDRDGLTNQPSPSVSRPQSTTAASEAGSGNINVPPTPEQGPALPPADGPKESAASPTTTSPTPEPRGRSTTRSSPPPTTPSTAPHPGDGPSASPAPARAPGSPIRTTTGCIFEAARNNRATGLGGATPPAPSSSSYTPPSGRGRGRGGRGRGAAPSDRGRGQGSNRRGGGMPANLSPFMQGLLAAGKGGSEGPASSS